MFHGAIVSFGDFVWRDLALAEWFEAFARLSFAAFSAKYPSYKAA